MADNVFQKPDFYQLRLNSETDAGATIGTWRPNIAIDPSVAGSPNGLAQGITQGVIWLAAYEVSNTAQAAPKHAMWTVRFAYVCPEAIDDPDNLPWLDSDVVVSTGAVGLTAAPTLTLDAFGTSPNYDLLRLKTGAFGGTTMRWFANVQQWRLLSTGVAGLDA